MMYRTYGRFKNCYFKIRVEDLTLSQNIDFLRALFFAHKFLKFNYNLRK